MIIYIFIYALSLLLFYIGYNLKNNKNEKILKYIFIFLGLLIPCLIAGFRDISVGNDTKGYILSSFKMAKENNLINYINYSDWYLQIKDYSYLAVTFIITKLFKNFNILLLFIEILIIVPMFISANIRKKNDYDVILTMAIFYLFFYNVTFNMARQSMAIAFSILGLSLLEKDKKIVSAVLLVIAIGFHSTAMISIFLYLIFYLFKLFKAKKYNINKFKYVIYGLSAISILNYKMIIHFLYTSGIYRHGIIYLEKYASFDFSFTDTLLYGTIICFLILGKKIYKKQQNNYDFYLFMAIEAIIILQLGAFVEYLERVSFYLFYPVLFNAIPYCTNNAKGFNKRNIIILIFFLLYWLYIFAFLNSHNTIPYKFI